MPISAEATEGASRWSRSFRQWEAVLLLFSFETNSGIHDHVHDVGQNVSNQKQQTRDDKNAQGHGIVALQNGRVSEVSHPVDVENLFDQERPRKDQTDHA